MATHRIESTSRVVRTTHVVEFDDRDTAVQIRRELSRVPATAKLVVIDAVRDPDGGRQACALTFEATEEDRGRA